MYLCRLHHTACIVPTLHVAYIQHMRACVGRPWKGCLPNTASCTAAADSFSLVADSYGLVCVFAVPCTHYPPPQPCCQSSQGLKCNSALRWVRLPGLLHTCVRFAAYAWYVRLPYALCMHVCVRGDVRRQVCHQQASGTGSAACASSWRQQVAPCVHASVQCMTRRFCVTLSLHFSAFITCAFNL